MTLREFSEKLYNYHKMEAGNPSSLKKLCECAKIFFMKHLEDVDEVELRKIRSWGKNFATKPAPKDAFKERLNQRIKDINDIIRKEADNDLDAVGELYNLLFDVDKSLWTNGMVRELKPRTDFYRVRTAEKYHRYDRQEMFAIAENNAKLVGAYRFNPSGYSCLYLASNLYLAWEECRRPDIDMVNFAHFVNKRKLHVLDLTIPVEVRSMGQLLMSYLALLCCAKATDEDKHHFQYVVPQMIMKVLRHQQKIAERDKEPVIDGIRYLSSRRYDQTDFLFDDKSLSIAYVFPQQTPMGDNKWDLKLVKMFELSEPCTLFLYKVHSLAFDSNTALVSNYQQTLFYQMEQAIKGDGVKRVE